MNQSVEASSSPGSLQEWPAPTPAIPHIDSLPDDILVEIFLILVSLHTGKPFQKTITSVCGRWRDLAQKTPLLWTQIEVGSVETAHDALQFLRFSDPALLDIKFRFPIGGLDMFERYRSVGLYNAITHHAHRLRSLTMHVSSSDELSPLFNQWIKMRDGETSHLESLSISLERYEEPTEPYHAPLESINALQNLDLNEFDIRKFPPAPNLKVLHVSTMNTSPNSLQELFVKYPLLETLVIHDFRGSDSEDLHQQHAQRIDAHSLRFLAIHGSVWGDGDCACGLPFLSMPNLEYLEVNTISSTLGGHHASMLSQGKGSLGPRRLRINDMRFKGDEVSVLSTLPNTTDLEITLHPIDNAGFLIHLLRLTNLHSLTINLSPFYDERRPLESFLDTVRRRGLGLGCTTFLRTDPDDYKDSTSDLKEIQTELKRILGDRLTILHSHVPPELLAKYIWPEYHDQDSDWDIDGDYDNDNDNYYDNYYYRQPCCCGERYYCEECRYHSDYWP